MRFNDKAFFELAKQNKLESSDVYTKKRHSLSVSIYHGEIDSVSENESQSITARGIFNGKFGSCNTEIIDKNAPQFLVNGIVRTASVIENDDPAIIYKGSEKYHKKSVFNKELLNQNVKEKAEILKKIEQKLYDFDKRINDVPSVGFEESDTEDILVNSYGLKLSQKQAYITYFAEVTAKQGDEIRSGYKLFASMDEKEFDIDKFVSECAQEVIDKLGSTQCASKKYPVVLNPDCTSSLLKSLLSSFDAEEIQKHTSLLEGKLGEQMFSKKLTVIEDPLRKSLFFRYFDDEGVATNKKYLIRKGKIENFLYTLQTAAKDNVEPTGNGYRSGAKASADTALVVVKEGKQTEDELFESINEGIYVTELEGLHSGLNAQSGNFSLQASGRMIRNGKLAEAVSLITVAGNLVTLFADVVSVANNSKLLLGNSMLCPSIKIKKLAVSGK